MHSEHTSSTFRTNNVIYTRIATYNSLVLFIKPE